MKQNVQRNKKSATINKSVVATTGNPETDDLPSFDVLPRPIGIPYELAALASKAETKVRFINKIGIDNGNGIGKASELAEEIQRRIDEQSRGVFTLDEAAQILVDACSMSDVSVAIRSLREARIQDTSTGQPRPITRSPDNGLPYIFDGKVLGYRIGVHVRDIDTWLEAQGANYRFPTVAQHSSGDAPGSAANAAAPIQRTQNWVVKTSITRFPGYRHPLYLFLKNEHLNGKPIPKPRDVLEVWKTNCPLDIQLMSDGLKYSDAKGNTKEASLKNIKMAIQGLIQTAA